MLLEVLVARAVFTSLLMLIEMLVASPQAFNCAAYTVCDSLGLKGLTVVIGLKDLTVVVMLASYSHCATRSD